MSELKLALLRGPAGSGKSTLAKAEYVTKGYKHYEADMFFIDEYGVYIYNRNLIKEAHEWCINQTEKELQNGNNVVVSNTFIRLWELIPYQNLAKLYNADVEIQICMKTYKNIHNIPNDIVKRHIENFER